MHSIATPQLSGSGGLMGGCFPASTLVHTLDGLRSISTLQAGDRVLCFDPQGVVWTSFVTHTHIHTDPKDCEVWEYVLDDGEVIKATPNHHFWCNGEFVEIGTLETGASLRTIDGTVKQLYSKQFHCVESAVYNITVECLHTYFVGISGIAASNLGGGKSQSSPTEEDDTGRSTSRAFVLEAISEGVIEGLISGRKSIYFENTPLQNADNSLNFKDFKFKFRKGSANQSLITWGDSDESDISSERGVNVEVKKQTGAVTRTIVNNELDAIRVRLALTLVKYEDDGDVTGTDLDFRILIKQGAGAFAERYRRNIKGKFASPVEFEFAFNVRNQGSTIDSFQVRIEKISDDSTSQKKRQTLQWVSLTEIIKNKINYRNTAIIGLQFTPDTFSSIPRRSYLIGGRTVRIPNCMNVAADRGLDLIPGVQWDNTLKATSIACVDPVWQLYDLLTNTRYGLGRYLSELMIDRNSFFECSKYNNFSVPTGFGGNERRYSCSIQLQTKEKAWDVISTFCSAFQAKPYWAEGKLRLWQDRPTPIVKQFTQSDVAEPGFVYASTAVRSRFTVALVSWLDPDDHYQRAVEPVEDPEGIELYGVREVEIVAFGCTSRSQAIRFGRWALYSSRQQTRTVSFTARSFAAYVRPGDLVQIADEPFANIRNGGLIAGATANSVTIDQAVSVAPGSSLTVMLPNSGLETRSIVGNGVSSLIAVTPNFSQIPLPESNWLITSPNTQPQQFRVLTVGFASGDPTKVEINAIEHNPSKYAAIESDVAIEPLPTRFTLPVVVNSPAAVSATWASTTVNNSTSYTLIANWQLGLNSELIRATIVEYSKDAITWQDTRTVIKGDYSTRFENVGQGLFYVRVAAIDVNGKASNWTTSAVVKVGLITYKATFNTADTSFFALDF